MKKWLKIVAGSFGAFYSVAKDLFLWLMRRPLMNIEQNVDILVFRIIVILSICYGIFLVCQFLYNLNKKINHFLDGEYSAFHNWLSKNPTYQDRVSGSFEDRVVAMLEWWKTMK